MKIELYKDPNIDGFHSGPRYWIAIDGVFKYFRMDNATDKKYLNWMKLNRTRTRTQTTSGVDVGIYKVKDLTEDDLVLEFI